MRLLRIFTHRRRADGWRSAQHRTPLSHSGSPGLKKLKKKFKKRSAPLRMPLPRSKSPGLCVYTNTHAHAHAQAHAHAHAHALSLSHSLSVPLSHKHTSTKKPETVHAPG
jgi:hypothetical protein